MSEARVARLEAANNRLREELGLPRQKVSETGKGLKEYCAQTKDPLLPSVWGKLDDKENPYAKEKKLCPLL
eukprot:Clim_evm16s249 gene=Clim_evmTU16s249